MGTQLDTDPQPEIGSRWAVFDVEGQPLGEVVSIGRTTFEVAPSNDRGEATSFEIGFAEVARTSHGRVDLLLTRDEIEVTQGDWPRG